MNQVTNKKYRIRMSSMKYNLFAIKVKVFTNKQINQVRKFVKTN